MTFDQPVGCADSPAGLGNGKVANGSPAGSALLPPASALAEPLLAADDLRDVEEQSLPFTPPAPNGQLSMVLPAADEQPLEGQRARRPDTGWQAQAKVLLLTTFFLSSLFLAQVFSLLFTTVGAHTSRRLPEPGCLQDRAAGLVASGPVVVHLQPHAVTTARLSVPKTAFVHGLLCCAGLPVSDGVLIGACHCCTGCQSAVQVSGVFVAVAAVAGITKQ